MILKKKFMNEYYNLMKNNTKLQKNVRESDVEVGFPHHLLEKSAINDIETLRIKNYFKNRYPLPLEPSLYSPIHLLGEKRQIDKPETTTYRY